MTCRAAITLLLLGLAGCGFSHETSSALPTQFPPQPSTSASPSQATDKAALVAAVKAYSAAFLGGDAESAYGMLSAHSKSLTTFDEFRSAVEAGHQLYGDAKLLNVSVDQIADGMARVTYSYSEHAIDQTEQPWVKEDGVWRYDQ
jgi:hypothetical protein